MAIIIDCNNYKKKEDKKENSKNENPDICFCHWQKIFQIEWNNCFVAVLPPEIWMHQNLILVSQNLNKS